MHNHTKGAPCPVTCAEFNCACAQAEKYVLPETRDGVELWQACDGPAPLLKVTRENGPVVILTDIHPDTINVDKNNVLTAEMANDRDVIVTVHNVLFYTLGEKA